MTTQKPTHTPPCSGDQSPELWGEPYSDGDVPCALCAMLLAAPETAAERDRLKEVNKDLLAALRDVLDNPSYKTMLNARAVIARAEDK